MNKYLGKSTEELLKIDRKLQADPNNRNKDSKSIYIYNLKTRVKLDLISWAIFANMEKKKNA